MDGMDELSEAHLQYLVDERKPANTIKGRRRVLMLIGTAGTAKREEIEEWWRSRADLAESTRANDLSHLRSFYRWAMRWEHRWDDPTVRIDAPNVPNGLPRPISRVDLQTLLDGLDPDMRRAACLGAYTGMRVSEAASIDWADVDHELMRIRVKGKGNKSRLVAFSPVLLDELLPITGGNVVAAGGKPYSASQLERKVNRAIERLGVAATFHQLRHRYGTLAYQATGDLIAVGRQMGHSSPVTTAIYAAASDAVADKIAQAVVR